MAEMKRRQRRLSFVIDIVLHAIKVQTREHLVVALVAAALLNPLRALALLGTVGPWVGLILLAGDRRRAVEGA